LKGVFDTAQRHVSGQMAEMTQFRQEVSASEKANISAIGDISTALQRTLAQEKDKSEKERQKLAQEITSLVNAMFENQQSRWSNAVGSVRTDLSSSQGRILGGFQLVAKGLDCWAERENVYSKKLLSNKDEMKKSIVEASKVCPSWMQLM
jgi:DNA anti-recombination protein RmuC